MSELALDDEQRHAFADHLDGMRVPELVRRWPPYAQYWARWIHRW